MNGLGIGSDLLARARRKGASGGDVVVVEGGHFSGQVRMGSIEKLSQAQEKRLGLRLFFGKRSAIVSTSDFSKESLDELLDQACALAQATAEDEASGLPEPEHGIKNPPDMDLYDPAPSALSVEEKIRLALRAEEAARSVDARISNSEGAEFGHADRRVYYTSSNGTAGWYASGSVSLSATPVAAQNGQMERDYWYSAKRKYSDLASPESVGREAARRALRRLGARKVRTSEAPVVFDPETAADFIGTLAQAVNGYALYKRASFLLGRLGQTIASTGVTITDDGTIRGGLGSRPFDGEGLASRKTTVIEKGVLKSYLLDTYSARKLGLSSTGNAARSVGDAPTASSSNFYLEKGPHSPAEIIRSVKSGLYVTEMIGFGVNLVTGDYSKGAVGLWIENGELAYPVHEITIAGNLSRMLQEIEMVGDDLEFRGSIASPTVKIARMTIAGD
jgi:PmbA protein